ncbi:MAG: hypothetical protein J6W64_01525 [Bacilli bacterium]|nr:hypothetical protein [Bacilli bacterium]
MCLYNCFSNEMPSILKYNRHIEQNVDGIQMDFDIDFNTQDKKYKIYMIPVKYLQDYTIAIDCDSRVEMFCGFYSKYFIKPNDANDPAKDVLSKFIETTYASYSGLRFNDPIVYDKLNTIDI